MLSRFWLIPPGVFANWLVPPSSTPFSRNMFSEGRRPATENVLQADRLTHKQKRSETFCRHARTYVFRTSRQQLRPTTNRAARSLAKHRGRGSRFGAAPAE